MITRRNFTIGAGLAAGVLAAPGGRARADAEMAHGHLLAETTAGASMSAERIAERIRALSGGRPDITVHAAGEIVPAFEALARRQRRGRIGHTASFYWQSKMPAAAFFTTVPVRRCTPNEHVAWVDAGGGQALWDELYAPFGVKPFMGGNTGVCMGGWFRREIKSLAERVRGLKLRTLGLGGEVYRRLGVTPQTTPPAEILVSLQSGVIDGAESVGPWHRHRARPLSGRVLLLLPRLQQAERHRRMHRGPEILERALRRAQGHRRACLRDRGQLRACRDGAAQRAGARRAGERAQGEARGVPRGPH